jgi:hypothetical protein
LFVYLYNIILAAGILTALVTLVTIIGRIEPAIRPEKVVSAELPTNLTVIEAGVAGAVNAPIKIAEGAVAVVGKALNVCDTDPKSG